MLSPSILPCEDNPSHLGDGYFITMTLDDILDFMQDVHSLQVSLFSSKLLDAYEAFLGAGGATGTVIGSITGLDAAGKALQAGLVSGSGTAERLVLHSEPIPFDGEDSSHYIRTKICGSAPAFVFSSNGTALEINFFAVERQVGLYYPRINIEMSNGSTSDRVGSIVGQISFERWGAIPIYNSSICFVSGSIVVSERYSQLSTDSLIVRPSAEFTIRSSKASSTALSKVQEIYLGRDPILFRKEGHSLILTAPKTLGQHRLLLRSPLSTGKFFNEFYFPDVITIAN